MDDEMLKKMAYIGISSYRTKAAKTLKDDVKTPTKIAKDTGIRRNHISKVLRELKESGVAECINEEVHRGRLYRLTSVGDEIVDELIRHED
ncbi:helix-turn-helix domain-containing protein [Methanobrevibacter sp.]|uniref:helix-turn-helix domain-containing protein n=1 Tax=Methanobrevibacter sp. TaxID=66852 RepID=UPI0025F87EB3|nr:helix-turn-helix domain-containing protein [Methanobrevibacter sp.]MBQ2831119.1 transcriptional regulator [Methanobrevibacter sp.]